MKVLRKWACKGVSFSVYVNEDGPFRVGGVSRQAQKKGYIYICSKESFRSTPSTSGYF